MDKPTRPPKKVPPNRKPKREPNSRRSENGTTGAMGTSQRANLSPLNPQPRPNTRQKNSVEKPFLGRSSPKNSGQKPVVEPLASQKQTSSFRGRPVPLQKADANPTKNTAGRTRIRKNSSQRKDSPLVYGARLLIFGIGVGVIAGTLLSVFDPATRYPVGQANPQINAIQNQVDKSKKGAEKWAVASEIPAVQMSREMISLKSELQTLASGQQDLKVGALFVDVANGDYVDLNSGQSFAAASTIKIPILVAFFEAVDAGKIRLDESLTMRADLIAKEAGDMQYKPPGTKFSALETVTQMIVISDNTATNMIIDRLGGIKEVNKHFLDWGLSSTVLNNVLPDLEGTNTTSAADMVKLMGLVSQGKLVSLQSRDRLLDILRRTANQSLLPQGLGEGAMIAHKTGDIGTVVGDVGLIDMPTGKRYLAAVIVKGPHNDPRSTELIRQFSRKSYQAFSQ